jgi:hypothetical protein
MLPNNDQNNYANQWLSFPPGAQAMPIATQATPHTETLSANFALLQIFYLKAVQLFDYLAPYVTPVHEPTAQPHQLSKDEKNKLKRIRKKTTASETAVKGPDGKLLYGRDYLEDRTLEFYNRVDNLYVAIDKVVEQDEAIPEVLSEIEKDWDFIKSTRKTLRPVLLSGLRCQEGLEKKIFEGNGCQYDPERKTWKPVDSGYVTRDNRPQSKTGVFAYLDSFYKEQPPVLEETVPSRTNQTRLGV